MAISRLTTTRLSLYELRMITRAEHPVDEDRFGYSRFVYVVMLSLLGHIRFGRRCDHDWQTLTTPEHRYWCNGSSRWRYYGEHTEYRCKLCGADRDALDRQRQKYPDLFPHQDKLGRWHLPILWPRVLKRWIDQQIRIIELKLRSEYFCADAV